MEKYTININELAKLRLVGNGTPPKDGIWPQVAGLLAGNKRIILVDDEGAEVGYIKKMGPFGNFHLGIF